MATEQQPKSRSRRMYIMWGVALALLVAAGLFSWLVVVPVLQVRSAAQDLISRRGLPDLQGFYAPHLDLSRPRKMAHEAVGRLGGPDEARDKLSLYLRLPPDWDLVVGRAAAVWMLTACGEEAAPILVRELDGTSWWYAAMALAEMGKPALPQIIGALEDPDWAVRVAACHSLRQMGPEAREAVPVLEPLLSDEDDAVRRAAADALAMIRAAEKKHVNPGGTMGATEFSRSITFAPTRDLKLATREGRSLTLPAGKAITGQVRFSLWDGPLGIREYGSPSFMQVTFEFARDGKKATYSGTLGPSDLLPSAGEQCVDGSGFSAPLGELQWLFDTRDTILLKDVNGEERGMRLRLMDTRWQLMPRETDVLTRIQYYDQDTAGFLVIFVAYPYDKLLFLKANKLYYDKQGKPEDYEPHGEPYVDIKFD